MSQQLGAERCFMAHHSGRYIMWTVGSSNIDARLAQGWTIHPSERNHLTRSQESKEENPAVVGLDPVKTETPKAVEVQEKRRPRIKR